MPPHRHTRRRPGESRPFHFVSSWRVAAPPAAVWEVLADVDGWPRWWPGIESARIQEGAAGTGARTAIVVVRSPLGYRLRFTLESTRSEAPHRSTFTVTGDLRGRGFWAVRPDAEAGVTPMRIGWCVVSDRRLVRLLAPLAPWAHQRIMAAGGAGIALRLGGSR